MPTTPPAPPPVRVAIAGATGYAGQELLRLLARHPGVRLTAAMSSGGESRKLPALARVWDGDVQPLDVEALARGVHMSAGHLSRQFKLAYGESPYSYLMTRRIERAMALLRRGDLSVTEVCFAVGCQSLGTFSTRFTELVGIAPSTYRAQNAPAVPEAPPCVVKQVSRPIRNREARPTQARPTSSP